MTGICEECQKECIVKKVDNGIGSYEYWGAKGFDSKPDVESSCCGASVYDDTDGSFITLTDLEHYEESKRDYYSGR